MLRSLFFARKQAGTAFSLIRPRLGGYQRVSQALAASFLCNILKIFINFKGSVKNLSLF